MRKRSCQERIWPRRFTFARIDISYARFFFLRKRGKSTIICAFKFSRAFHKTSRYDFRAYDIRRFTFARIDISYARFFFYESAEKVLSYARLNCAVLNYFYMSLGQVRQTIVVSRYQNHRRDNEIQL